MKKIAKTGINITEKKIGGKSLKDIVNIRKEKTKKTANKKKIIITISVLILILVIGITILVYYSSRDTRNFLDQYLFRKNITQEKLDSISLDYDSNINIFAYNKYICILAENKLMEYNSAGKLQHEISLEINNPEYSVNNKYIAISEKGGSTIHLISDDEILWSKEVDGNIAKINVNDNGYVSAILTGTTYKTVIVIFDNEGNELFKNYLATSTAVDTSISNDNQYLAFAEVNTTGTSIQSNVKVISIKNATERTRDEATEPIIAEYAAEDNKLIVNIEYHKDNRILCMYDSEIAILEDGNSRVLLNLEEKGKNINFANINLENHIYRAVEENDGIFNTNTILEIENVDNERTTIYTVEGAAKYIYSDNNIIAVNLGQEIEFVNTSGWLLKRYSSMQEVQDVVIGNGVAGIIYEDKVEILSL